MPKRPPNVTDFTVAVTINVQTSTRNSNTPKSVLVKLSNLDNIRFSIQNDTVVVESADG